MNTVKFIGNAGKEARITTLPSGDIVANFNIATSETFVDRDGVQQTKTEWHPIVAWGKTAESVRDFVKKGSCVVVKAKAVNRTYKKEIDVPVAKNKIIKHEIDVYATEYQAYAVTVV